QFRRCAFLVRRRRTNDISDQASTDVELLPERRHVYRRWPRQLRSLSVRLRFQGGKLRSALDRSAPLVIGFGARRHCESARAPTPFPLRVSQYRATVRLLLVVFVFALLILIFVGRALRFLFSRRASLYLDVLSRLRSRSARTVIRVGCRCCAGRNWSGNLHPTQLLGSRND